MTRARAKGVKSRPVFGSGWSCSHDPATATRYVKGKPKGCAICHREKARGGKWYNPERSREYQRKNREKLNAYRKLWSAANRPRSVSYHRGGAEAIEYVGIISSDPCVYCGATPAEVDHILAVTRGGTGRWENLASACRKCNASKQNKDVLQFMLYRLSRAA